MRRFALPVASAEDVGHSQQFDFVVAGDISETEANIVLFNRTLRWSIAVFSLGLIAAMLIQVRVGLMPLRAVSEALARIREGRARRLEGEFPSEIAPLATELNSLIAHSSEVVGRARGHVANLAHFSRRPAVCNERRPRRARSRKRCRGRLRDARSRPICAGTRRRAPTFSHPHRCRACLTISPVSR